MGLRTLSFGKRHYMIIKILTGIVLFLPGKILQELGRTQSNRDWCCVVSSDEAVEIWDFFFSSGETLVRKQRWKAWKALSTPQARRLEGSREKT